LSATVSAKAIPDASAHNTTPRLSFRIAIIVSPDVVHRRTNG
jgi:hypothetical protein